MKKEDLKDILQLIKDKLERDTEAACGLFYSDENSQPTSFYAVGEEDGTLRYSIGE